jgi:hypothetical protein
MLNPLYVLQLATAIGATTYYTNLVESGYVNSGLLGTNGPVVYQIWTNQSAPLHTAFSLPSGAFDAAPVGAAQQIGNNYVITNSGAIGGVRYRLNVLGEWKTFVTTKVNNVITNTGVRHIFNNAVPGTYTEYAYTNIVAKIGSNALAYGSNGRVAFASSYCPTNISWNTNGWFAKVVTNWNFYSLVYKPASLNSLCGYTYYQRPWTMLTKRHGVTSGHMYPAAGDAVMFLTRDGTPVWRTNLFVTNFINSATHQGDIALGVLNEDLPGDFVPAMVLALEWNSIRGFTMTTIPQEDTAGIVELSPYFEALLDTSGKGGDSGSPMGFFWSGRWVVFAHHPVISSEVLVDRLYPDVTPEQRLGFLAGVITNVNSLLGIPQVYALEVLPTNSLSFYLQ